LDSWQGITCSTNDTASTLHILGLQLPKFHLVGYIPASLGNLTFLQALDLSRNSLDSKIPDTLGDLANLNSLNLATNVLTGTIPLNLGRCVELLDLNLATNLLTGSIPTTLGQCTQLTTILLFRNHLIGTIPESLGQCTLLTTLQLRTNYLTGSIPASLGQCTELVQLSLFDNHLTGTIPATIGQCTQLTQLYLHINHLNGTIPSSIGQCTQLIALYLYQNALTGVIPSALSQCTQLSVITLNTNLLSGSIPETLDQCAHLHSLVLWDNRLTGTIPSTLGGCTELEVLNLQYNQLTGPVPTTLEPCTVLYQVFLYSNQLTGTLPAVLFQSSRIAFVYVDDNFLTGTLPANALAGTVGKMSGLKCSGNQLTGTIPSVDASALLLQTLHLENNLFTGTIAPSLIDAFSQMKVLSLALNAFSGRLPSNWSAPAVQLAYLYLDSNHLTGPVPESLGGLRLLRSLNLSSNRLTGTLPAKLQDLSLLEVLMLQHNKLHGSIDTLFNAATQANLSTVQLSGNQLTATLPAAAFLLPSLSSFAAVDNCFEGPLPDEAMCSSTSLTALVLDGLHAAECNKGAQSVWHSGFVLGTLPSCLLRMRSLNTLHLSGSGLTGSLPAVANISAVLADLTLSHNLLTGEIAGSFLNRDWDKLDLSYNRLTGTLRSARHAQYVNNTELYLQHNRLSGVIPGSVQRVGSGTGQLSILTGNLFSCKADRSDLPKHDANHAKYLCGSDAVDDPLYVWLAMLLIGAAAVGLLVYCASDRTERVTVRWRLWWSAASEGSVGERARLPELARVFSVLHTLAVVGAASAVYCVVALLPVYASSQPSYTYEYAWTLSGTFLSGTTTFGLETALLLAPLPICGYFARRWLRLNHGAMAITTDSSSKTSVLALSQQAAIYAQFLLFNLAVVGGVNVGFVFATLQLDGALLTVIQVLLAVFKLGFNTVVMQAVERRISHRLARGGRALVQQFAVVRLLMALLNNILVPCVVVVFVSPSCLFDLLTGMGKVTSSYLYGGICAQPAFTVEGKVFCLQTVTESDTTSYTPPFTYSYQCSSSFVTYYAPTFAIMCIISGFVLPAQRFLFVRLKNMLAPTSRAYAVVSLCLPRRLQDLKSPEELALWRSNTLLAPIVDASHFVVLLMTYLSLLLTFGALFPPLAVCCAVAMASVVLTARLEVGRYVSAAVVAGRQDCLDEVESACEKVSTPEQLRVALDLVLTVSCVFYTLFLFDTLGDEVGFAGAFWVLIVVPLLPFVALAVRTVYRKRVIGTSATQDTTDRASRARDPEPEMELGTRLTDTTERASDTRLAGNPLHNTE
jgi:Leucine-rich repeat (LRR) protein